MEAMNDLISMSITLHIIFIVLALLLALLSLVFINQDREFRGFSNRVESVALQYYFMLAALFFTGLVVFGATGLVVTWQVVMMVGALGWIIFTSAKLHQVFKRTREVDIESQKLFKMYARKKYMTDIALIIIVAVIMYAVSL
jgi:hypothetical protein